MSNTNGNPQPITPENPPTPCAEESPDLTAAAAAQYVDRSQALPAGPPVTIAIIGAGQRGKVYAEFALANPHLCKVVAVAEPRKRTRELMVEAHLVPEAQVFKSWEDLLAASSACLAQTGKRIADAVVVAVQDNLHAAIVTAFAEQQYHILCEKPLATTPEECIRIHDAVKKSDKVFGIGHVLRYSPYNRAIADIIRSGELGKPINIVHIEPVGHYHFAHSYVRGDWAREKDSSFSLMTKSCHDIDILGFYLSPSTPVRVSSFGSLTHFRKSEKPVAAGPATRCMECPIRDSCPYSAKRIYLDPVTIGERGWPASTLTDGPPDIESVTEVLQTGPYGKCVYESDNDVVDHQVVNLEYSTGATCSFTMVAFTEQICNRSTRIHFTHGELIGDMKTFTTTNFTTLETKQHAPLQEGGGHGGGDLGLMRAFVHAVREGRQDVLGVTVDEVLRSHMTVFAAEKSRKEGKVISCQGYEEEIRRGMEAV
ncbi:hypothetical protein BOTBODRAFT_26548 [Botryobasidium botryosum FD-172 SS1]|uniref:Gfo/Idh/MocA-like oxidoreductase N-terminal domain-containing protein n=1 Tax=Botryobasidium botryosum (strain FD-172 SS1) TaxID=930990 RepID=A0A067N0P3_BOTB1|nr:hypothetical protein BOTBODRAFT_26548 [Botryobasidium botryosum FD-172 SS1]